MNIFLKIIKNILLFVIIVLSLIVLNNVIFLILIGLYIELFGNLKLNKEMFIFIEIFIISISIVKATKYNL